MALQSVKGESINIESLAIESTASSAIKVKCLVQQCSSAKLFTKLPENGTEAEFVEIDRGIVLFVCFMKDAQESDVDKLVKSVLNVKLSELDTDPSKHCSILDLPGSILIVPQACLGGRMKGKLMQYHNIVNKDVGLELYQKFISLCKKYTHENAKWSKSKEPILKVCHGTYGIRQVYTTVTNGPYLHLIEH